MVQAMLMFGLETWVLTPRMGWALGGLQHRVARRITGRQPKRREYGGWEYPPLVAAIEEASFEEIGYYILKRQKMVAKYISTPPILDHCDKHLRRPVECVARRWWGKRGRNLAGER